MTQETVTVQEYIFNQQKLESDALEALPYDPKECSYDLGPLRQQLYACLTCFETKNSKHEESKLEKIYNAVCYTCSIECHTSHHLVPLYTKRNFQCDCGTSRIPMETSCQVRCTSNDVAADTNRYNLNFEARFCVCEKIYDEEDGNNEELADQGMMIQCMLGDTCGEDWFHESCILGLESCTPKQCEDIQYEGFPNTEDFEAFICWKCNEKWKIEMDELISIEGVLLKTINRSTNPPQNTENHTDKDVFEPKLKKRRVETKSNIQEVSVFLKNNYKSKLIATSSTSQSLQEFFNNFKHICGEDTVYEPELETSDTKIDSMEAINSIPREKAIEGIIAYNDIKDKLKGFLKGFAEEDRIVGKEDITIFFERLKKGK